MSNDRITEEADWKDGMNAFREKSCKEFTESIKVFQKSKKK